MDSTVARLNIEHFRRKLAEESDETRRQTLLRLLAEEEQKLAQLTKQLKDVRGRR
jgi:bacterioferritin (cytochrome b1)